MKISLLKNMGTVCPTQWEGSTPDCENVYIRYRWGSLTVSIDHKLVYDKHVGGGLDGYMTNAELVEHLTGVVELPEIVDDTPTW